jgi:putative sterol carrier protein
MWWSGVETLAAIHTVDWRVLGLDFLGAPGGGTDALDRQLDHFDRYLAWAAEGEPQPVLEAALAWLREHRFEPERIALCWGDARLPNLIFRDDRVAAVLDWEMAFLCDPEADLAWWLFMDWQGSEGFGIPRLSGFPGREETVRRYEELTGTTVRHLDWHEVFAALRFGAVMVRVARHMKATGIPTPTEDFQHDNPATQRLAELLGIPSPAGQQRKLTNIDESTVKVQFHLTGSGGQDWYLVADRGNGTRHPGVTEGAEVTLTATAADWGAIQRGEMDRTQAYLGGKLVIEGDMTLLMQLDDMITRLAAVDGMTTTAAPVGEAAVDVYTEHMVTAEDDARHAPGAASLPLWNESFWFALYDENARIGVTVRAGMHPNRGDGNIYLLIAQDGGIVHTLIDLHAPLPAEQPNRLEMLGYSIDWEEPLERFRLRYRNGNTAFDLTYEGSSPIYIYPFPPQSTSDQVPRHIEHAGIVRGTVTIGGVEHRIHCIGHRDHSWGGERDWAQLPRWDYLSGEFGRDFWFNVVKVSVAGVAQDIYLGGVWDGKELLRVSSVRVDVTTADGGTRQTAGDVHFIDARGREHHIVAEEVLAIAPVWFGRTCVKDGFTRYRYRDRTGYGILEHAFTEP